MRWDSQKLDIDRVMLANLMNDDVPMWRWSSDGHFTLKAKVYKRSLVCFCTPPESISEASYLDLVNVCGVVSSVAVTG